MRGAAAGKPGIRLPVACATPRREEALAHATLPVLSRVVLNLDSAVTPEIAERIKNTIGADEFTIINLS